MPCVLNIGIATAAVTGVEGQLSTGDVPEGVKHQLALQSAAREMAPAQLAQQQTQAFLDKAKKELYEKSYYKFSSEQMQRIMKFYGATEEDMEAFGNIYEDPTKLKDPVRTMKYINSRLHVFPKDSDAKDSLKDVNESFENREYMPHESIVVDDDVYREGNGGLKFRPTGKSADWFLNNTAAEALLKLTLFSVNVDSMPIEREGTVAKDDPDYKKVIIEAAVQQTEKDPNDPKGLIVSASPEGIHQDGNDTVLIVFHSKENVKKVADAPAGQSKLFKYTIPKPGPYADGEKFTLEDCKDSNEYKKLEKLQKAEEMEQYLDSCVGKTRDDFKVDADFEPFVMEDKWEAYLIVDQAVYHEARGKLQAEIEGKKAVRNMLTLHSRRPDSVAEGAQRELAQAKHFGKGVKGEELIKKINSQWPQADEKFALDTRFFKAWKFLVDNNVIVTGSEEHQDMIKRVEAVRDLADQKRALELYKPMVSDIEKQAQKAAKKAAEKSAKRPNTRTNDHDTGAPCASDPLRAVEKSAKRPHTRTDRHDTSAPSASDPLRGGRGWREASAKRPHTRTDGHDTGAPSASDPPKRRRMN